MVTVNGKETIRSPCDYGVVRNGILKPSTNSICVAGYKEVGGNGFGSVPDKMAYDYKLHKQVPNPRYAEWEKKQSADPTRIDVVYYSVTNTGHDRWVEWFTVNSPMAKFFDKTPLIVDDHDIHSLVFRQRYGLVFTPEECRTMRANHMFGLIKGFRIGWCGESRENVDMFFALLDRGVDERKAFRMAMGLQLHESKVSRRHLSGHHQHFYSSDPMVLNMYDGVYDTTNTTLVVDGPKGYTWWNGADSVYGTTGCDARDLSAELNAFANVSTVKSRFGASVAVGLTLDKVVEFANAYEFKPTLKGDPTYSSSDYEDHDDYEDDEPPEDEYEEDDYEEPDED